jgi:hypothetical protein
MRKKGRENPEYTHGEEGEVVDNRKWYEKLDPNLEIPYVGRPKGKGTRIDFYVMGNLPDMALEIKEASGKRFKNTNDIHRAAHYIGMYIMREREVKESSSGFLSRMYKKLEPLHIEIATKTSVINEFKTHFEQYCLGKVSEKQLKWAMTSILDCIACPNVRQWADDEFNAIMANSSSPKFTEEQRKAMNRMASQKYREKKKELNLRVVAEEE